MSLGVVDLLGIGVSHLEDTAGVQSCLSDYADPRAVGNDNTLHNLEAWAVASPTTVEDMDISWHSN